MSESLKYLKKGSVAKFKELFNKVKRTPLTPEQREEILDVFKRNKAPDAAEKNQPKKIAKPDQDIGV